mmetsp:Transcript_31931/g.83386  ORF Transcript_31931/g.83386 Transcript_31931/m.83386 type:complete len:137 (-) Transcript_31931:1872-2282(-)
MYSADPVAGKVSVGYGKVVDAPWLLLESEFTRSDPVSSFVSMIDYSGRQHNQSIELLSHHISGDIFSDPNQFSYEDDPAFNAQDHLRRMESPQCKLLSEDKIWSLTSRIQLPSEPEPALLNVVVGHKHCIEVTLSN